MPVSLIWAQARGGVIGDGHGLPWNVPADMAYFREQTLGRPVVMGRVTWDSLPPRFRPLPGRRNLVCTRDPHWAADDAERAGSVEEALDLTGRDCAVIGGGQVYAAALALADECLVTVIDAEAPGQVRAPALGDGWECVEDGEWISDPRSRVEGVDGEVRHRHTVWRRLRTTSTPAGSSPPTPVP